MHVSQHAKHKDSPFSVETNAAGKIEVRLKSTRELLGEFPHPMMVDLFLESLRNLCGGDICDCFNPAGAHRAA